MKQYDKLQAAQHQLEGAIANLFLGNWPAAITLAGAAEDILPIVEGRSDAFKLLQLSFSLSYNLNESEINAKLNEKRNWLKHKTENLSKTQNFTQADAIVMIIRALSRYSAHEDPPQKGEVINEAMSVFWHWYKAQDINQIENELDKDKS